MHNAYMHVDCKSNRVLHIVYNLWLECKYAWYLSECEDLIHMVHVYKRLCSAFRSTSVKHCAQKDHKKLTFIIRSLTTH